MSNGQTGTSSGHLDRTIDEILSRRARQDGGPGAAWRHTELVALVQRLADLDPGTWDRAVPLGPDRTGPIPEARHRRGPLRCGAAHRDRVSRVARVVAATAAAVAVLAAAVTAATVADLAPPRSGRRPTAVLVAWRLAGYIDQPAWRTGGTASEVGLAPTLTCTDGPTCFAVDATAPEGAEVLETTVDGGSSWRSSVLPTGWRFTSGLACASATECSAGGSLGPGDATTTGVPAVLTTDDGGAEWHAQALPSADGAATDLACGPGGHCVGFGLAPPAAGSHRLPVAVAGTAGPWTVTSLPPQFAAAEPGGLACPTTRSCVLVGADTAGASPTAAALYSDDGGTSWTTARLPSGLADVRAVSCADPLHCTAVATALHPTGAMPFGPSDALATTDGGRTWSLEGTLGTQSLELTSVSCTGIEDCWAAGQSEVDPAGTVVRTTDGGASWAAVRLPTSTTSSASLAGPPGTGLVVENVSTVACTAGAGCTALGAGEFGHLNGGQVVLRSGPAGT